MQFLELPCHLAGSVLSSREAGRASAIAITTVKEFGAMRVMQSVLQSSIAPAGRDDRPGSRNVPPDARSPFGRQRTGTPSLPHAACPPGLGNARRRAHSSASQAPKRFGPQDDESRGRDDDPERCLRQIAPGRDACELPGDEFEMAFDQGEVRSCLPASRNARMCSSGMTHVMAERGYASVKPCGHSISSAPVP